MNTYMQITSLPSYPSIDHCSYPSLDGYKKNNDATTSDTSNKRVNLYPSLDEYKKDNDAIANDTPNKRVNIYPSLDGYKKNNDTITNNTSNKRVNIYPTLDIHKKSNYIDNYKKKYFLHRKKALKVSKAMTQPIYNRHVGFKNEGLFCWLNSSLKLLIVMLDIEDISLIKKFLSENPNSCLNQVRSSFIDLWCIYNNFNEENRFLKESKLENAKNFLIRKLQKYVSEGENVNFELKQYFLLKNPNVRQDTNAFIEEMETILGLDNPTHALKVCTYIEATYTKHGITRKILRKSYEDPFFLIRISPEKSFNSINHYIKHIAYKVTDAYEWNAQELLQQGIVTDNPNIIKLTGNKFEMVEADLNNLDNFIIYFHLSDLRASSLKYAHKQILAMVLSDNFPNDYINMYNSNNIEKQYGILVTAKAIICFTGHGAGTHYVCLTIEKDKITLHNDSHISVLTTHKNTQTNYNLTKIMHRFFDDYDFTPYAILYETIK